jgi:hypothetical protein
MRNVARGSYLNTAQDGDESFLRQLLRARRIFYPPPEERIDQLPIPEKQFAEGFARAFLEFKNQFLVSRHRRFH